MRKKLRDTLIPHHGNGHTPHLLSHKGLLVTLALVVIVELSIYAGAVLLPKLETPFAAVLPSIVTLLTNDVRAGSKLPALKESEVLARAAQAKAEDMASKGYFAHQSPDGSQPWDWIARAGYDYVYAGENLAVNFTDSEKVVEAWQDSPTHHLNLVGPRYSETGVGVASGEYKGREAVFVVQMFASPQVATAVPVAQTPTRERAVALESAPAPEEEVSILGVAVAEAAELEPVAKAVSSPRTYGRFAYYALAGLFLLVLVLGLTPLVSGKHHPKAAARGLAVLAVVALLVVLNERALFSPLELPVDNENAATALLAL